MQNTMIQAPHHVKQSGILPVLDLPCFVLDNGQRVISVEAIEQALCLTECGIRLTNAFLGQSELRYFIHKDLAVALENPVCFFHKCEGSRVSRGYPVDIIPQACYAAVQAHASGGLPRKQKKFADKAGELLLAFADLAVRGVKLREAVIV